MYALLVDEGYKAALINALESYKDNRKLSKERAIDYLNLRDIIERKIYNDTLSLAIAVEDYCLTMKTGLKFFGLWFSSGNSKLLKQLNLVFNEYPKEKLLALHIKQQNELLNTFGVLDKARITEKAASLKEQLERVICERDQLKLENDEQASALNTIRSSCTILNSRVYCLAEENADLKGKLNQLSEDFKQFKEMFFNHMASNLVTDELDDDTVHPSSFPARLGSR